MLFETLQKFVCVTKTYHECSSVKIVVFKMYDYFTEHHSIIPIYITVYQHLKLTEIFPFYLRVISFNLNFYSSFIYFYV